MPAVNEVRASARSADGAVRGYLRIALLPKGSALGPAPLIHVLNSAEQDDARAAFQLLEGQEYLYEWDDLPAFVGTVSTDPEEVFQPDTLDGRKGRLRPGLSTGAMQVTLRSGEETLGQLELEVRSRKLNYLSEYRWMLRDIADQMTELVMNRFAVSSASFTHDSTADAVTLYQRFAFLQALIKSESFQIALHEITRRPHVAWEGRHEAVSPGQSVRASAHTVRQLGRAGLRTAWPEGPVKSIPVRLDRRRTEATLDTTPNRFVRFALERWRQVVADIARGLASGVTNSALARGRREVGLTLEYLDTVLNHDLFKDLGPLTHFPADNQVLQRREGYRDIFRAYLEFELAARLSWRDTDSRYQAGQRDVATLYEYWVFLQLARVIAKLAGKTFDLRPLVKMGSDGLNLVLQAGKETVVSGFVERFGRKMEVQLCFNRTFRKGTESLGSWTRPMRPDCSIVISTPDSEPAIFEPVVLHFDAKYRVNLLSELFGTGDDVQDLNKERGSRDELGRDGPLRADLLKMHAYRDAIQRSAGAYVLYPGGDEQIKLEPFKEYHELLPGLGAFVLRPSEHGDAAGTHALRTFVGQVLDHVAMRLTQHERGRYWLEEIYQSGRRVSPNALALELRKPGPETTVLLGYVKNREHWEWITRRKTYNVRTIGRAGGVAANAELLRSRLLLLYSPDIGEVALGQIVSDPEMISKTAMKSTGYPEPASDYLCVQWSWAASQEWIQSLSARQIDRFVQERQSLRGAPTAVRWGDLAPLFLDS